MKQFLLATLTILFLAFQIPVVRPVHAQQEPTRVPEAKRHLILELTSILNQRVSPERVVDSVMREMQKIFEQHSLAKIQESTEYTAKEKERLINDQQEISAKIQARVRQRFASEIDMKQVTESLMLSLYDKYFTESELVDLIAFYKTPTGQKTLTVMPELLGESIRRSGELLGPKISTITREVIQEVHDELRTQRRQPKR